MQAMAPGMAAKRERRRTGSAGLPLLLAVLALIALSACGDVQPDSTAQSIGNAANKSLQASSATPAQTATVAHRPTAASTPAPGLHLNGSGKTSNGCTITAEQTQAEQYLLNRLNQHRRDAGVAPLALSAKVSAVSRAHSCDMDQHHNLSHTGSDGSTLAQRLTAGGISYSYAGENIGTASGYGLIGGITANDNDMMAEPLQPGNHRWNIVNTHYTQVGIGIIYVNGQEWMTEDFTS